MSAEVSVFGQVFATCVQLVAGRPVVGARHSVGAYTPALRTFEVELRPWVVMDLRGAPVALAGDPFEAARFFVCVENEEPDPDPEIAAWHVAHGPSLIPTDAECLEWARADRERDMRYFGGW